MRTLLSPAVVVGILFMAACGGGSSNSPSAPTPAPTPPPPPTPVTTVIFEGSEGIPASFLFGLTFTTTATGTIGATVDWTFATNDLDIALASGTDPCTVEQVNADTCPFLGFSDSTTAKPETISVPNLAAGNYTLYVANYGSTDESFSYQITLTSVPGATGLSTPSTSFGRSKGGLSRIITAR